MTLDPTIAALLPRVDLLSLDAGNTLVFLDHGRLARICVEHGVPTTPEDLNRAEAETKLAHERRTLIQPCWSGGQLPAARSWAAYIGTMIHRAGAPEGRIVPVLEAAWREHRSHNLWSLVPAGLVAALERARDAGVRVVVVSNSEGELEAFLGKLGVLPALDLVVDSGLVGVEKPDPRIFRVALDRFAVPPDRALHLGDIYGTDVGGARAAGIHAALVDPFGHLGGRHPDVPRVASAAAVADALATARARLSPRSA